MISICAEGLSHKELNEAIRAVHEPCTVTSVCGQRFIAAGTSDQELTIEGIPGNALGAYLNGGTVTGEGSAQDAVGDTMNAGTIVVHGSIGDAAGYAMRGGKIYVRGNAGYRAGIHMKAYREKVPLMVIGGRAGSFLGEYQAGGVIIVLNLDEPEFRSLFHHTAVQPVKTTDEVVEFFLSDPKTKVFINHNNELGQWLYSIQVVGSGAFWLCSFNTQQEAEEYIRAHKLKLA